MGRATNHYTTYVVRFGPFEGRAFSIVTSEQGVYRRCELAAAIGQQIAAQEGREYWGTESR